jgi:hypothetical protein
MVSRIEGSTNIHSVAITSIFRSVLGSSGASRSMVPMLGKSTYRHDAKSATPLTYAAPAAGEGSGTIDVATSRSPVGGGGAESSSTGTITTSTPLGPVPAGVSNTAWAAVFSVTVRPSSMTATVFGGGGAPESSTAVATANPSSNCTGSGSAYGGWGRGSEGTTRALKAKRLRGARLSTPVSECLREDRIKVSKQDKSKSSRWRLRA